MITLLFTAMLTALVSSPARAQYPRQYQMGSVEALAYQIETDAARLMTAVQQDRHDTFGLGPSGAARIEDLRQAADAFQRDIKLYGRNPLHTGESYKALSEAWAAARPFVARIGERPGTRTPAGRINDSMQILGGYYSAPPTAAIEDWKMRQLAADILRLTGNLADHVRLMQLRGETDPYTANQFEKLSASSYRFYAMLRSEKFDSRLLGEAYSDMVDKLRGARDVAGRTNLNAQTDLGTAWSLAQQLGFVSPGTALGQYQIHDFYR